MDGSGIKKSSLFTQPVWLSLLMGVLFLGGGLIAGSVVMSVILMLGGADILNPDYLQNMIESGEMGSMHLLRWGQGASAMLMFALSGYLWARFESHKPLDLLKLKSRAYGPLQLLFGMLLIITAIPFVESLQFDAESFRLPESMKALELSIESMEAQNFKTVVALLSDTSFLGIISNLIVIGLIAAVAEEIFFRGFLQQTLARFMNIHLAIWLTGFIFSAIHFQFLGFFSRFILGVLMGYLFVYSGSLWTSILAHFANNALNVIVAAMVIMGAFGEVDIDQSIDFPFWLTSLSVIATGGLFFLFLRLGKNGRKPKNIQPALASVNEAETDLNE